MVLISAGNFSMGEDVEVVMSVCQKMDDPYSGEPCEPSVFEEEAPRHTRTLDDYYIDKYEVTNAAYASCVQAGVCDPPDNVSSFTRSQYYGNPIYEDYPVIFVSWWDAKTYCEWREARLPTEAEWEKAARGTDGRLFPWGHSFEGTAMNFCDKECPLEWGNEKYNDGFADTSPVGNYPEGSSPYGVMDMAGNVWEWTSDWFDVYPGGDPYGDEHFGNSFRVIRSGSWGFYGLSSRTTNRGAGKPNKIYNYLGIRCVRDIKSFDE
jgi:formylglycine-generating enzyme required for sulfatase activity